MTTTTQASSSTAPKPVEHASKVHKATAKNEADKPGQASDLFAALLALASDTRVLADPDAVDAETASTQDDPQDATSPTAAMLAWIDPRLAGAATAAGKVTPERSLADPRRVTDAEPGATEGIDISGMARVDEAAPALPSAADKARAAAASRPAFSPLNPNATTPAVATSTRAADAMANASPSVVWQRAQAGTDSVQAQNASPLAQVRSTVALNERFGAAGAPLELAAAAPLSREFTPTAGTGRGPAAGGLATGTDTGTSGLVGTGSSGDAAGGYNDHAADAHTGDGQGQHPAEAGREAEAPTVSHWGTQHLRHASLRVGGEGSADAIDIQLQVKGQEVQVNFQTDNAEARAQLRESAGESLADLMQRSGIQLGSVSVGSQHQQHHGDTPTHGGTGSRTGTIDRAGAEPQDLTVRPLPPRTDGSRPLDVFA